ncbi:MAG TPA: response regulator [Polyangia bacterium]|nr:response regulator [Polyangia bacterium]
MMILVVDDDVMLARSVKRLLESRGHSVLLAHTVDTALSMLACERPAFVLTDFDLADACNGADLACWARNAFRVPAAIMTAHDPDIVRKELRELGVADVEVLPKPFALDEVVIRLAPYNDIGPWPAARAARAT